MQGEHCMKNIIKLSTILMLFFVISCEVENEKPETIAVTGKPILKIEDSRLSSSFSYHYEWKAQDGINEKTLDFTIVFNGTNKCTETARQRSYSSVYGWTIYTHKYEFELKINDEKNKIAFREWTSEDEEDWGEWHTYTFSEEDRVLVTVPDLYFSNMRLIRN